jgi:protein SCO1/2
MMFSVNKFAKRLRASSIHVLAPVFLGAIVCAFVASCNQQEEERKLPILGQKDINGSDTIYHTIGPFKFVDQDSSIITNETVKGKIYVADFFFTSCRTICPVMKSQMLRVYESIKDDPQVLLVSHTIDPEYDTVGLLHDYADRLGVKTDKWHFLTGNKDSIYYVAQTGYFATAMEDSDEPGGFIHSGAFLLIDKKGRIRGKYDGTNTEEVNKLLKDIAVLEKRG